MGVNNYSADQLGSFCARRATRAFATTKDFTWICVLALIAFFFPNALVAQTADPLKQHYEAANRLASSGDREHAFLEYRAFLAEALHRVANGRAETGKFDSAEPVFEEALHLASNDSNVKFDFARACLDNDRLPRAKVLSEEVTNSSQTDVARRLLYARTLFHLGDFQSARTQLEQVFAVKPEFNTGYLLGKTYLLLHQDKEARRLFDGMARNFGDTAETHIYFGRAYSETDYPAEAVEEFHRAMAKDDHASDAHYYLGLTYLGHNESAGYSQAIPEFRAELERNKNDFRSYYMLGYIALKRRDFTEAEAELQRSIALQPDQVQSLLELAEVYDNTNRFAEEESILRKAISLSYRDNANEGQVSRTHYLLGRLLEKSGRHQQATEEMKIVAEIQKRLGPSSTQTADARTKEAQDETRRAEAVQPEKLQQLDQFERAIGPVIADAYNNLGAIVAGNRDYAAAMRYFQSAKDWNASLEGIDLNLGRAAYLSNQLEIAAPALTRYLQQHPEDSNARSVLGLTWFKLGDYQKVVDVLRPIASAIHSNPEVANAYNTSLSRIAKN
jgi:tetratricopeptide (TPR) repeat protein